MWLAYVACVSSELLLLHLSPRLGLVRSEMRLGLLRDVSVAQSSSHARIYAGIARGAYSLVIRDRFQEETRGSVLFLCFLFSRRRTPLGNRSLDANALLDLMRYTWEATLLSFIVAEFQPPGIHEEETNINISEKNALFIFLRFQRGGNSVRSALVGGSLLYSRAALLDADKILPEKLVMKGKGPLE